MRKEKKNAEWPSEFAGYFPGPPYLLTEEEYDIDLLEEINIIDVQLELLDDDS